MAVEKRPSRPGGPIYYEYTDVGGGPLFRVVRRPGKRFHQERFDLARGRYVKGLGTSTIRVLYNLPGVFEQVIDNGTVFITEGEKDADELIKRGIAATTNPGGAGKWRDEYSESLRGAGRVVIAYDLDEPDPKTGKRAGEEHALQVAESIRDVVGAVDFVRALEGKDVSDHFAAGHNLSELIHERPSAEPAPKPAGPQEPARERSGTVRRDKEPAVYQLALQRLRDYAQANRLPAPRLTDRGYEACCPAHDDRDPSLGIRVGEDQPMVVNCQTGCEPEAIAEALGIDYKDFFDEGTPEYDGALQKELQRQRVQQEARIIISSEAAPSVVFPDQSPVDYFNTIEDEVPYSITNWHVQGGNTLLVAQYKTGKDLDCQTPLPTPDGWTTMGQVKVGNWLLDEAGRRCMVTFVTPIMSFRKCYRVSFSDGTHVIAGGEHQWVTRTLEPEGTHIWTTSEILRTLRTSHHRNHRIDIAGALDLPKRELLIDPYTLGVWLGDGTTSNGGITFGDDGTFFKEQIGDAGYVIGQSMTTTQTVYGLKVQLREIGVLDDKHIPIDYLRASYEQRLALLQGIMDTDGTSDPVRNPSSITTVCKPLALGYMELMRSLGLKPTMTTRKTKIDGKVVGKGIAYVIGVCAYDDTPIFRLPRKRALLPPRPSTQARSSSRTIVAVEPVESVDTRCLQVDSPSSTFLCGEGMIPTHNTSLAINLYRSLVNTEPFLGTYPTAVQGGRVAYFDYEMLPDQFRFWLKAGGDINFNRMVTPYHLRGQTLPLWDKRTRAKVVDWLKRNDTSAIIIDTAARAWAGLVENENSNTDMLRFTDSLDALKYEAGITDLFLVSHMGRQAQFMQSGEERARGATRLEDWMDAGWYMTKDENNVRYLRATGRGVDMEPIMLNYSAQSHRLSTQGIGKNEHQERTADEEIVDVLAALSHAPTTTELAESLKGRKEDRSGKIHGAERRGLIERRQSGRAQMVDLTENGRELQSRHRNLSQTEKILSNDEIEAIEQQKRQMQKATERQMASNKVKRAPRRQRKPKPEETE